jgi:hypothetical protein
MMSKETGGPAFPGVDYANQFGKKNPEGMTLRDYFAAKALQGMLAENSGGAYANDDVAEWAYHLADAMLEARK